MADLDDSCTYKVLRRRTAVPITVTLNLIACAPSPPAHRSTEEHQSLPYPWIWTHPKACNPCDMHGVLQPNTRRGDFAANTKFPRTGGPSLRRKPAHCQRAYGHIYDKYVYRYCIPSVVDMDRGRSPAIPPYRRRFRYLHCPLFIKSTDGYSGSPSIIVHPEPLRSGGFELDFRVLGA